MPSKIEHAFSLERLRDDHRRLAGGAARLGERIEHLAHVVAVDGDGVPAKRAPARDERVGVAPPLRRPALAEPVDVGDRAQIVEMMERADLRGFPDRSFRGLAVAQQHVRAVVGIDAARVERNADTGGQALTERSGRDVHERQARRRMALEIRRQLAKLEHLIARERARRRPRGIENRRGVSLRQHEAIGFGMLRVARIEPHLCEKQRRDDVSGGQTRRRVSRSGGGGRSNRIDSKLCGDVLERGE